MTEKEMFEQTWEKEFETTLKVLNAYPGNKMDFKPHERSMSAKELAWQFVQQQMAIEQTLDGTMTMPPNSPPVPDKWEEILATYQKLHPNLVKKLQKTPEADLFKNMPMMLGPGNMGEMPKLQFLWLMLSDLIHHRGQCSVYLRMAGGKVPSIYGPSADEPWM